MLHPDNNRILLISDRNDSMKGTYMNPKMEQLAFNICIKFPHNLNVISMFDNVNAMN